MTTILDRVLAQVKAAEPDLRAHGPTAIDWVPRAEAAVQVLVPWLQTEAPGLKEYLERVLNAPNRLKALWDQVRAASPLPGELVTAFEQALGDTERFLEYLTGEVASAIVMTRLAVQFPNSDLRPNSKSDYPDLWLRTSDYTALPKFSRKVKEYGAALKGNPPRPVRVPDGLEVKTCRGVLRADCHHDHIGLHLAVVLNETSRVFTVSDIAVAFLRTADYTRSDRNTTATTDKFSFGGAQFISLLGTPEGPSNPQPSHEQP